MIFFLLWDSSHPHTYTHTTLRPLPSCWRPRFCWLSQVTKISEPQWKISPLFPEHRLQAPTVSLINSWSWGLSHLLCVEMRRDLEILSRGLWHLSSCQPEWNTFALTYSPYKPCATYPLIKRQCLLFPSSFPLFPYLGTTSPYLLFPNKPQVWDLLHGVTLWYYLAVIHLGTIYCLNHTFPTYFCENVHSCQVHQYIHNGTSLL